MSKSGGDEAAAAKVIEGFQNLRLEQRNLVNKLSELEQEHNEYSIVIDTLKTVDEGRKCFQMIGGVLFEKTVKDVLPSLNSNKSMIGKVITSLTEQVTKKGVEINEYKERHDLKIRGQSELPPQQQQEPTATASTAKSNVLVTNN